MKITINCGALRAALHRVKSAARGNKEGPATLTVRPGELEVQMSGGGSLAKAIIPIEGGSHQKLVINGAKALSVLSTANGTSQLDLVFTDKDVRMKFENASIRLPVMDSVTDLLSESIWDTCTEIIPVIKGKDLKAMLAKVTYACARGDVRYYLNSVNLAEIDGHLAMVATNGHILSAVRSSVAVPEKLNMLLPVEVADVLPAMVEDDDDIQVLLVGAKDEQSGFGIRTKLFELKTPLLQGVFPDWKKVMPERTVRQVITTNPKSLAVAIERVRLATADCKADKLGVWLDFTSEGINLKDPAGDSNDVVGADCGMLAGAKWECSFNPAYLLASLKHVDGNINLIVDETNSLSPLLLMQSDDDAWCGLVMPLKS